MLINPYRFAAAGFTPLGLYASGEKGGWYDSSDLSTLWQDTGGTVAVTADGQSVARMDDKSGNGNHWTQGTASKRPVYKTSGGLHWLQFDGVDDVMRADGLGAIAASCTLVWGVQPGAPSAGTAAFSSWDSGNNTFDIAHYLNDTGAGSGGFRLYSRVSTRLSEAGTDQDGIDQVISSYQTDGDWWARRNQTSIATDTSGDGGMVGNSCALGAFTGTSQFAAFNLYALIVREMELTGTDLTDAEEWAAGKAGVTL